MSHQATNLGSPIDISNSIGTLIVDSIHQLPIRSISFIYNNSLNKDYRYYTLVADSVIYAFELDQAFYIRIIEDCMQISVLIIRSHI